VGLVREKSEDSVMTLFYSQADDCYYFSCRKCGGRTSITREEYDSKDPVFMVCKSCRKETPNKKD
jgi:predicted SprT family Zn-dependent metalloprotease